MPADSRRCSGRTRSDGAGRTPLLRGRLARRAVRRPLKRSAPRRAAQCALRAVVDPLLLGGSVGAVTVLRVPPFAAAMSREPEIMESQVMWEPDSKRNTHMDRFRAAVAGSCGLRLGERYGRAGGAARGAS